MPGLYTGAAGLWGGFTGLLYGSSSLSTPPGLLADCLFGSNTPAGGLLNNELSGLAVDLISSPANLLTRSYPTNNLMNYSGPPFQVSGGPITFSRASLATVTDADGRIKWAPHNLLLASEQFDASSWTKTNATVTANAVAAPNNTTTADKLIEAAVSGSHWLSATVNITGIQHTVGIFAKAAERTQMALQIGADAAFFNLSNGTIISGLGATITNFGSGWYYCTLTTTPVNNNCFIFTSLGGTANYTGDGTSGILIWGAHLYRSDLGGMQANASAYPMYNPTTPKNLLGWSEAFDNAAWFKSNSSVSANLVTSPNGSLSADKLTEDTSNNVHSCRQTITVSGGTRYTLSFYAKAAGRNWVTLDAVYPAVANNITYFDLANGVVGTNDPDNTASITSVGDGWYRCAVSHTTQSAQTSMLFQIAPANANNGISYTGDGTSGIFLWGAQLSDSASLDPYVGSYGAAPTAAAYNGPRLDYNGSTLAPLGLLVEEQRSNLELQSNAFSTSPWFTTGTIARSQDVIGPDGLISAWTITDNDASALSSVIQDVTISNDAATRVGSIYIRKTSGATTFPGVGVSAFGGTSVNQFYTINTNTGVAIARNTNTGIGSCSVRDFGAFWRVEITNTNNSTGNTGLRVSLFPAVNTDGGADWTVAPTGSVVFYGAQLEAGAFATSYIPTAASTVTRSVDVASVATSQFPYGITDGSFIVSYSLVGFSTTSILASLNDGTPNNVIEHIVNSSTQNVWRVRVGGTNQTSEVSTTASGINKVGGVYNNNYFASTANGATVVLDTSGSIPTGISQLNIGNRAAVNSICGHIRQITYLPRRITNSELQQRTS